MNQTSKLICQTVHSLNTEGQTKIAAYSIDAGFHVFAVLNVFLETLELVFQVVDFVLIFVYDLLFLSYLFFVEHVLLSVDEVLKLSGLTNSDWSFFEPLLVSFEFFFHIFCGYLHRSLDELFIWDVWLLKKF